jgi:hypothetical protein
MSTVVIFGYVGGAPGTPGANAVQCQLNDAGDENTWASTGIPNIHAASGRWDMIGDPHAPPTPLASPRASKMALLSRTYWRTPVSGMAGNAALSGIFTAGMCIEVSGAEWLALNVAGAIASY